MPSIDNLLSQRYSTRAYLPKPVTEEQVRELITIANKSASGGNMQPWNLYVLAGAEKDKLIDSVAAEIESGKTEDEDGSNSYPDKLKSPYRERRYACGMALYDALDIKREDKERRKFQWQENYRFFGAPVGILLTLDEQMGAPQHIDVGIYLQSLMLAAKEMGLDTCAQRSWSSWPTTCAKAIGIPECERVVVGLSLGYGDDDAPINQYRVERVLPDEVCNFFGF